MLRYILGCCCVVLLTPVATHAQQSPSDPAMPGSPTIVLPRAKAGSAAATERITVNDNRTPSGRPDHGARRIRLEAKLGTWYPEGDSGPGLQVAAFAEEGRSPMIPGPLLRVPTGTEIRATVRNSLDRPLLVGGLHPHDGTEEDSLFLVPGQEREVRFRASTPGTYFYRGRFADSQKGPTPVSDDQLIGAFIIDYPAPREVGDRVLLISRWTDPMDTVSAPGHRRLHTYLVNGLAWPHTERLTDTVGDSVRWRVINASRSPHPMHLHGFYYQVDSRGDGARDTVYTLEQRRTVVTEFMAPGTTMAMTWVPKRPGNWLFHCHLIAHVSTDLRLSGHGSHAGGHRAGNHAMDGMAGLVTGIHVLPRPGAETIREADNVPRRKLRAFINTRPGYFGSDPGIGFVLQEGTVEPAADSMRMPGSSLVLTRGDPVEIVVHNRARTMVSIHWHGIELDSYFDGVGDWSGDAARTAPPIAPGDSFVVRMTPDRAGTFIYHTHMEEGQQLNSGLYGPLIVLEPGERIDPETDHILLLGWYGPGPDAPPAINGDPTPNPLEMKVGMTYRLRLINITPSAVERVSLLAGSVPLRWRAFAKDGATLPGHQATFQVAQQTLGPGETYDFDFTPERAGSLTLRAEVRSRGVLVKTLAVPVHVR